MPPHAMSLKYSESPKAESDLGLYSPRMEHSALDTVSTLEVLAELNWTPSKFPLCPEIYSFTEEQKGRAKNLESKDPSFSSHSAICISHH